jgi:uncharacterized Fe-S center protein
MLEDLLAKKSIKLSYADGVEMPKSNASAPAGKKILKTISAAVVKVEKFSNDIINGVQRPVQRKAECLTKAANSRLYKNIEEFDKKFTVTSQCSSCGLCVQICPVNNIKRDNQQHIWLHKCERCLRCLQWCPNEAIQYGKRTINWKRYHNPDIKVKDILN